MKKEVVIVGAGLSGLVAAINLARRGYAVKVLERESRVGGSPLYHPSGQGTFLRLKEMSDYIGVDLSEVLEPIRTMVEMPGRFKCEIDTSIGPPWFFERGPRSTSVDSYLYGIAREEGVEFEFGRPVYTREELSSLPPSSIVATGLHFEGFDLVGQPYLTSHHFTYKGACDPDLNYVHLFHDRYTTDYGYTSCFRGIRYVHLFNRHQPISLAAREAFARRVREEDGFEVPEWNSFTFPVPAASFRTPRLLLGDKILAGTLAGAMDNVAFFGLHGALVSGRIAALAVEDRYAAWQEFRKCTLPYRPGLAAARLIARQPSWLTRLGFLAAFHDYPRKKLTQRALITGMPGYLNTVQGLPAAISGGEAA
jgi:hypothetical protein